MGRKGYRISNKERMIGYASLSLFGFLMLALLFPIAQSQTQALETLAGEKRTTTPTIGVSLASSNEWEVNPSTMNGIATTSSDLRISVTGASGYKVYLSGKDGQTSLSSMDASVTAEISSIAGETALINFPANTWGYSLGQDTPTSTTLYQAVSPTADTVALQATTGTDAIDRYHLSFATKVSTALPAGAYTGGVVVSVVATPWEVHTISDLTYMQDMTSYVCQYSTEHETKQLIDTRDGKSYWVAKLKDGNCWMTQNLALDLDVNTEGNAVAVSKSGQTQELNSSNTDIPAPWQGAERTETSIPLPNTQGNGNIRSWNLGDVVLLRPTTYMLCPGAKVPDNGTTYPNPDSYNSIYHGQSLAKNCPEYYRNVEGMTAGFVATENSSVSMGETSYDAHYLIGNYYQYGAATAGTGLGITGTSAIDDQGNGLTNAKGSICPKGWELPKSGVNMREASSTRGQAFDINGSFYRLISRYGYKNGDPYSLNNRTTALSPTYIIISGFIAPDRGSLRHAGEFDLYWSSTIVPDSSSRAYDFYADPGSSWPTDNNEYFYGMSVRCVAH